jgi:ferrous iron transport protein B
MKLSELKTGESGVIAKVYGHGGFRKRIIEMGFIKGENVEVILDAPLRDPVKYKIMDYEVSLRRAEAELIEVVNEDEAKNWDAKHPDQKGIEADTNERIRQIANIKGKELNVVFVGNPNSGKTSIFNIASGAHERVGNYSGVTVDAKEGRLEFEDYTFNIVDLPGTYSLSAYSPEELYVRKYIIENKPDVISVYYGHNFGVVFH